MKNKIAVITMVKNEEDIIESFARHALSYADVLLVTDHQSTDETRPILESLQLEGLAIQIDTFQKIGYLQAEVMTQLLYRAIEEEHADIVVAADADEFLVTDDERMDAPMLRAILQALDASCVYYLPWVEYALSEEEQDNSLFLLSRPCRKNAEKSLLCKVIVGARAAMAHCLSLAQGNHQALFPNMQPTYGQDFDKDAAGLLHIAHFPFRSHDQRIAKPICGWLANVAQFSPYTYYASHWQIAVRQFLETGDISAGSLAHPVETDISRYTGAWGVSCHNCPEKGPALLYTKTNGSGWIKLVRLAESIAENACRERILSRGSLVSLLVVWDGDEEALTASLGGIASQTYPHFEVLLLDFDGKKQESLRRVAAFWERTQPVRIISAPVFQSLTKNARGEYVQWVMPGDVLAPEKLMETVMAADASVPHPLVITSAAEPTDVGLRPNYLTVHTQNKGYGFFDWDLQKILLKSGLILLGGLSGALFRREMMERADWFAGCFLGPRPMELSAWLSVGKDTIFIPLPLVRTTHRWTADDFILHAMEWRYSLEQWRGRELLPEAEYQEAFQNFRDTREKMAPILSTYATQELYTTYMEA